MTAGVVPAAPLAGAGTAAVLPVADTGAPVAGVPPAAATRKKKKINNIKKKYYPELLNFTISSLSSSSVLRIR